MVLVTSLIWIALAQGPTTPLSGTVVGPTGEPVAGADLLLAGMPVYDPPILARGRSDAQGRFTLDRPAGLVGQTRIIAPMLWVVKPGFRLSVTKFPGPMPMPGAGEPVRVVLEPPGKAAVRVERPNGEPLAGARVRVERFGRDSTTVPDAVIDLIEAKTDKDGLAVVSAADNEEVAYVDVHSKEFGIQGRPFYPLTPKPKRVWLRPASLLKGQFVADDPKMVKGWRVTAYTRSGDSSSPDPETTGYATGTSDDEGRFSFPVIAPGGLQLELKPPGELPVLADLPTSLAVIEGQENSLVIPLRKTATITGVVRERGTGRPVPGVEMTFGPLRGGKTLFGKTDAEGRYTFPSLPGAVRISLMQMPPTHVAPPGQHWKDFQVAEGAGRIELEPREALLAAPPLQIVVRDEAGKPVASATITAQSLARTDMLATDDRGESSLSGVAPGGEVTIEAHRHERTTDAPVKAVAGDTNPVIVTIVPGLTLAATGRVLGPGGTPVSEASVKVQFRKERKDGQFVFPEPVRFDDGAEIRTGPDGTFRTPKELSRKARDFRAEVTADGFLSNQTAWVPSTNEGDLITLPDLALRRSRTLRFVSGRVVDREGKGIAAASVFQSGDAPRRTATTTDAEGRFRLAGVPSGEAFVFAAKAGFRFGGAIVRPEAGRVDVRLARMEEPPLSIPKSLPPLLTRAEERALGRELLAPLVVSARSGSLGFMGDSVVPALARVDPERVLAMLENRVLTQPASVLKHIALAQLEDDPPAAVATIEADSNSSNRAEGFLALADAMTDSGNARRNELLDRALAAARRVDDRETKLQILGHVADRWLDFDALARATPILREGQAIMATIPPDKHSFALEEFADVLAVIDLATARSIFERKGRTNVSPTDPATINRHLGEAAVRLAAIDPAEAERLVLGVVLNFSDDSRTECVLRVCRRMARADLARARKILDTINQSTGSASFPRPAFLPYGLGLMASELTAIDPAKARGLLDEAFAGLRELANKGSGNDHYPAVSYVMGELLPLVERLEPDRLEERLWLTAACRASLAEQPDMDAVRARVILAMLVSRYDRAMAAVISAAALERLPELLTDQSGVYFTNATPIPALAAYDPRAVVALIKALPDSARKVPDQKDPWHTSSIDAQLRLAAAEILGLPVEERRQKTTGRNYQPRTLRRIMTPL